MYPSLEALEQTLLTSDEVSAENLISLFEFAAQPEQFAKACHLLAQFYHADIIPNEENLACVIQFKNMFVPMPLGPGDPGGPASEDQIDHYTLCMPNNNKKFFNNLFQPRHTSKGNVSLGLLLIEYIFPTQDDDINTDLLLLMSKAVSVNHHDTKTKEKVLSILEYAEEYYNWDPDSEVLRSIPDFKAILHRLLVVKPSASAAMLLFQRNNAALYTVNLPDSTLSFQKGFSEINIFSYLKIEKELLLGILTSMAEDHEVCNSFAEEVLELFIFKYENNPASLSLLDGSMIKIYLKAKEDTVNITKHDFRENDLALIIQELRKKILPYFSTTKHFTEYLIAAAEEPRWFSINAVIRYARSHDLSVCFWECTADNRLQRIASSTEQVTTLNTKHLLLKENSFYELTLKTADNQLPSALHNESKRFTVN